MAVRNPRNIGGAYYPVGSARPSRVAESPLCPAAPLDCEEGLGVVGRARLLSMERMEQHVCW